MRSPTTVRVAIWCSLSLGAFALESSLAITDEFVGQEGMSIDVKRGEYLFKGACGAYCHSVTPELRDAPYLFDCEWIHGGSDDAIFKTIFSGVLDSRMPAFAEKLPKGAEDIYNIIGFLKSRRESCD